ncbi:tetratricopeptide repeat protein [Calothrix sp. PCC 6303]|uniref:tetratricopeptide repeat protein n=1 Tax=Calothrix sp. PCC 6303 TaxID=1170562 RepID=UPI0002A00D5E|nr:tetratricopeptide repeat protein [Calothrix sp. PCC 6303]AFZ01984.1 Tetratricopeptide TPR_1 repeat-containing protein [Calothrix sp. PCC 6303]
MSSSTSSLCHLSKGRSSKAALTGFLSTNKWLLAAPLYLLLFASGVVMPILMESTPVVAQKASTPIQRGYKMLDQGLVNQAIAVFQQVLKSNPQSLQAKLGLAIGYRRAGKIDNAWNAYQQVLIQDPNNLVALKTVGLLGTYKPQWQMGGIKALTTLLQQTPNDVESRSLRAVLYFYQGRQTEAMADFQIVLAAGNPSDEILLNAAQAFTYGGNYPKALELFNRYGKPITGDAAVAYGRALRENGNVTQAVQVLEAQLRRSNTLDRTAVETRKELAVAYIANNQASQAVVALEPLKGRADAVLPLARSLNEIRKRNSDPNLAPQIISLYRQAIANNPQAVIYQEAADVLSGLPGGEQTAIQLYRQLVAQQPNNKGLLVRQLALESKLGVIARSDLRQRLATVLQTLPNDPAQQQQLAFALSEIGIPDPEFLPVYQSLAQSNPNVPMLYFRIAQISLQLDDMNGARSALAAYTATPMGSKDLAHQLLAAEIERREGNLEGSAKRYQALLKSKPDRADIVDGALQGLVGVRRQQKRYDDALAIYDQILTRSPQSQNIQLGRTAIAYQAKRISEAEARAILENWLATQPATNTPPELYTLVQVLPVYPERETLYEYLAELDPGNIPMQIRVVETIAQRSPAQARGKVKQLMARLPQTASNAQLQAQLAKAAGDLQQAGKIYEKILAQEPDNLNALVALGGIRFEQRQFESAEQIYSQFLEQKPDDVDAKRAVADLTAILDKPLAALNQMEELQVKQMREGGTDSELSQRMQQIQEEFLQRRGFQPAWEDYERRK